MKRVLFMLALAAPLAGRAGTSSGQVDLLESRQGSTKVFSAQNRDKFGLWHAELTFTKLQGMELNVPRPIRVVLKPGEKKELARASPKPGAGSFGYAVQFQANPGDPNSVHKPETPYLFPFAHGTKRMIGQGYFGRITHQGLKALDFEMPTGTPVHAAREGLVTGLKQDSNRGGLSKAMATEGNFIDILHDDGTWASYAHLKLKGARVKLGQRVKAGELIGLSGATGMAEGPHLHFSVQKARWNGDSETLDTKFLVDKGRLEDPREGRYYYAWHPGLPDFKRESAELIDEAALEKTENKAKGRGLSVREEKIDNAVILWVSNGTSRTQEVTLRFAKSRGVSSSKPLPLTRLVKPGKEAFFTVIRFGAGGGSYSLGIQSLEK